MTILATALRAPPSMQLQAPAPEVCAQSRNLCRKIDFCNYAKREREKKKEKEERERIDLDMTGMLAVSSLPKYPVTLSSFSRI